MRPLRIEVEGFTAFVEKRTPSWVPVEARPEGRA